MKQKKSIYLLLISLLFFLTACRGEPMIQLNEENQKKIEAKKEGLNKSIESGSETEVEQESFIENESLSEKADLEKQKMDKSDWVKIDHPLNLSIEEFLLIPANEIRTFTNGHKLKYMYLLEQEEDQLLQKIMWLQDQKLTFELYSWQNQSLSKNKNEVLVFYNEGYDSVIFDSLFSLPIMMTEEDNSGNKIQAIYSTAKVNEESYQNVLEIKDQDQTFYLAQGVGLIAEETDQDTWILDAKSQDVMLISKIQTPVPQSDGSSLLKNQETSLKWQTNQDLALFLTQVFQEHQLIGPDIQVNYIQVLNNYVQLDFSPGVVSTMNAHDQGEQAVIAAIVATVRQFTGIDKVQLTVNHYGLLPNTFPYPENGLYQYNSDWLSQMNTDPFSPNNVSEEEPTTETQAESLQLFLGE